jgi:hypothetical protein
VKRALVPAALVAVLLLGAALRLVKWREWPGGPWIDEVYFLRAARLVETLPEAPLFGSTPLLPPEFPGHGTLYPSNVYLRVVSALDHLAGGGLPALRAMSIGPALLLFLGSLFVAWEATRHRPAAFLPAGVLLATSIWLLTQGRWACDVVFTSALLAWSAGAALSAARTRSRFAAVLAGVLLGLAQYGYLQSRLALAAPLAVAAWAAFRRERELLRLAAAGTLAAGIVAAPLFVHLARNPDRATAHVEDLSILARPPAGALAALGANVRDYVALFTFRGDAIPRHGDPTRPILLPGVAAFFAFGLALAIRRGGPERFLALMFGLFLAGALLARDAESANASRLSPAAPFVLTLAALGGADLAERLGRFRTAGRAALWAVVLVSAALDVAAFVRWARAPAAWVSFGVPERDLADAVAAEIAARVPAEVVLHPVSGARNVYLVDVLLGRPGDGARHTVKTAPLEGPLPWTHRPAGDVLYAADGGEVTERAVAALGGRLVARRRYPPYGRLEGPRWALYRIPAESAGRAAEIVLATYPILPARPGGNLPVPEEALYQLATGGGVRAWLDGQEVFPLSPDGPGAVVVRLARGVHELHWVRLDPRGNLILTGPDGFVIPFGEEPQPPRASSSAS